MRIYVVMQGSDAGQCAAPVTARLTEGEADRWTTDQELIAMTSGDEASWWEIVELDMPLSLTTTRAIEEGATR